MNESHFLKLKSPLLAIVLLIIMFFRPMPREQFGSVVKQACILLPVLFSAYFFFIYAFKVGFYRTWMQTRIVISVAVIFLSMFFSFYLNMYDMTIRDAAELSRPFYYLFAALLFVQLYEKRVEDFLFRFLIFFAIIQIIVGTIQLLSPSLAGLIGLIYSAEKVNYSVLRVVGTVSNPNFMALYIIAATIAADIRIKRSRFFLLLPLFGYGVAITGSVFAMLMFFLVNTFILLKRMISICRKSLLYGCVAMITIPLTLLAIYGVFIIILQYQPRIVQLIALAADIANIERILQFENIAVRLNIWQDALAYFAMRVADNPLVLFLGAGPQKSGQLLLMDNEYLLLFFRYGLVGILICLSAMVYLIWMSYRINNPISVFSRRLLYVILASSLFYDTLSTWALMPLYLPALSFMIGSSRVPDCRVTDGGRYAYNTV